MTDSISRGVRLQPDNNTVPALECRSCGAGAPVDEHFCPQCSRILALGRHGDYFTFLNVPRKLVLSAQELEDAVIINPYDCQAMGNAVHRALIMPQEERIERWRTMMERISRESLTWWRESFIDALSSIPRVNPPPGDAG